MEPSDVSHHHQQSCMNDKDKEALDRWKKFQKASHVGKNGSSEEDVDKMMMIQQQQLMRRQIEEQGLVIVNQQKIIHEQHEYIMTLKEQRQALIQECQQAGLSIPDISSICTQTNVLKAPNASQTFLLPPSHMSYPAQTPHHHHHHLIILFHNRNLLVLHKQSLQPLLNHILPLMPLYLHILHLNQYSL